MGNLLALDGNGYLKVCKTYVRVTEDVEFAALADVIEHGLCAGYLRGVIDTTRIWHQGTGIQTFCLPEAEEFDQLIRVTIKYLEDNPAQLPYNAAGPLQMAFIEAFPCTEGN